MKNIDVMWWVGSVERSRNYPQTVGFSSLEDEHQFKMWHPEAPTENRKQLQERFDEREKIEWEWRDLEAEKKELVEKWDGLQKRLLEVERRPAYSKEEQEKKQEEIRRINEEIRKVNEEIMKVKEEIKMKKEEFYRARDKVEEAKELVIEDEHKQNQFEDEQYRKEKEAKANEKIELLMSA